MVMDEGAKSSRRATIWSQALSFRINIMKEGFEIENSILDENISSNIPVDRSLNLGTSRNQMMNHQLFNIFMEQATSWDQLVGRQDINQLLAEWFHQSLPRRQVLGLLIAYFGLGDVYSQLFLTEAQQGPSLHYNNKQLMYRPELSGPFLFNPLNWLFPILLLL